MYSKMPMYCYWDIRTNRRDSTFSSFVYLFIFLNAYQSGDFDNILPPEFNSEHECPGEYEPNRHVTQIRVSSTFCGSKYILKWKSPNDFKIVSLMKIILALSARILYSDLTHTTTRSVIYDFKYRTVSSNSRLSIIFKQCYSTNTDALFQRE